jgi:hypothetical protein
MWRKIALRAAIPQIVTFLLLTTGLAAWLIALTLQGNIWLMPGFGG